MENKSFEDMPEAVREAVLVAGAATFLSLAILKYQDQIMEMSGEVTRPIKDAFGVLLIKTLEKSGEVTQPIKDALGETFGKILDFLGDVKERVMSLLSSFSGTEQCTADDQATEASTIENTTRSFADRIKDLVPN